MKRNLSWVLPLILLIISSFLWLNLGAQAQEADTTSGPPNNGESRTSNTEADLPANFTYQGLIDGPNGAINDTCSFSVALKEGSSTLDTLTFNNIVVEDGYFALDLAYSSTVFDGRDLALDTTVSCSQLSENLQFSSTIAVVPYARHAQTAESATTAQTAVSATNATNATNAVNAQTAESATTAQTAVSATNATNATNAVNAQTANSATTANHAQTADSATNATNATSAINATYATTATIANNLVPGAHINGNNSIAVLEITNTNYGGDGIRINAVGDDGISIIDATYGLNIVDASNTGVFINDSSTGIRINTSSGDGLRINNAGDNGVEILNATGHGVEANSTGTEDFGGYFTNSATVGSGYGVFAKSNLAYTADLILGADSANIGEGLGILSSDPNYSFSDLRLESLDEIEIQFSKTEGGISHVRIFNEANTLIFELDESGNLNLAGTLTQGASLDERPDSLSIISAVTDQHSATVALSNGRATVQIPAQFLTQGTVTDYQVLLTPVGSYCPLYIAEKQADSFVIAADNGADCTATVDYQITAEITPPQPDEQAESSEERSDEEALTEEEQEAEEIGDQ